MHIYMYALICIYTCTYINTILQILHITRFEGAISGYQETKCRHEITYDTPSGPVTEFLDLRRERVKWCS